VKVDAKEEGAVWMHKGCLRKVELWMCLVVIAWGLGLAETAHAQKVGVVDLQAVLDQSVRGRSAKDRLRELGDRLQQEIKTKLEFKRQKEEELQKLQTEFRSQKDLLTEQARAAKDEDYRRRARELKRFIDDTNRFTEDATQEFREREIRETQGLLLSVRKVVQEIGEREGYSLVLEGNENTAVVLYFNKAIDITPKIVQRFDQLPPDQTLATPPTTSHAPSSGKKR
jgi:outer membrane protein